MAILKKALYSLLLLSLLSISINAHDDHTCEHDNIEQTHEFLDVIEDIAHFEGRGLATYPNIRIYPYYEFVKSTAPSSYASYITNKLIPPAIDYFQSALRVKSPVVGNLLLSSSIKTLCGERSTPSILKSGGVAADTFIYFDTEAASGSQIANSKYCYQASGTKRPLVTRIMINRNMLKETKNVLAHEKNMYTLMHEITHCMGFSSRLFPYFIDSNGKTRKGHIKTASIAGSTRTLIDVPPLTEKLRNFYGCSTLQGAIMENSGGSSTASSHFERHYFVYEFMSSGSILGRKISEFSLSLLEGSGWYAPDYSYAEPFFYGQGQGCSFVTSTCSSSSAKFEEFCVGSSRSCAPHGRGGGSCSSDSIMDGCRFHYPNQDYDCENDDGGDYARLPSAETYGRSSGSKCFSGTLNTRSSNSATSFCFKYSCSGSGSSTQVEVQVGGKTVTCTEEGKKSVDGYYGTINCPDPLTFCNTVGKKYCPKNCMGRGTCVNGKCQCKSGYSGTDCALTA